MSATKIDEAALLLEKVSDSVSMWAGVYMSFFDKRLLLEGSFGLHNMELTVKSMRVAEGTNELERLRMWVEAKVLEEFPALAAGGMGVAFIPAPAFGYSAREERNMMAFNGYFDLTYTRERKG